MTARHDAVRGTGALFSNLAAIEGSNSPVRQAGVTEGPPCIAPAMGFQ